MKHDKQFWNKVRSLEFAEEAYLNPQATPIEKRILSVRSIISNVLHKPGLKRYKAFIRMGVIVVKCVHDPSKDLLFGVHDLILRMENETITQDEYNDMKTRFQTVLNIAKTKISKPDEYI